MILNISLKSNSKSFSMLQQYLVLLGKVLQHAALVKKCWKKIFLMLQYDQVTHLVCFYNQVKLNTPSFAPDYLYVGNWRCQILCTLRITSSLDLDTDTWRLSSLAKIMWGKSQARQGQTQDSNPLLSYPVISQLPGKIPLPKGKSCSVSALCHIFCNWEIYPTMCTVHLVLTTETWKYKSNFNISSSACLLHDSVWRKNKSKMCIIFRKTITVSF